MCEQENRVTPADVVDHRVPHNGPDDPLCWDESNLQALCFTHHNGIKQRMDKGGGRMGCDANGIPIDPDHHWR